MPHRRATIAYILGRLRPSNTPEQGGTLRDEDRVPAGTSSEALTQWNVAKELSPRRRAELAQAEHPPSHRRAVSLGPQKPAPKADGAAEPAPDGSEPREERPELPARNPSRPAAHKQQPGVRSPSQVHAILRAKEKTRQERRRLKASGDYLPVTGFHPTTGEWEVLTPTDSVSSDPISSARKEALAKLEMDVQQAQLAFEQAKSRRELEKDSLRLEKALAKLAKLQTAKDKAKQDSAKTKWRNHRGDWLSATEPNLSPIAQSLSSFAPSNADEQDNCPSPSIRRRTLAADGHYAPFLQETSPEGAATEAGKHQQSFNESDDTVIHSLTRRNSITLPNTQSFVGPDEAGKSPRDRSQNNGVHFLWAGRLRRRDPRGSAGGGQTAATSWSTNGGKPRSRSLGHMHNLDQNLDHFIDLEIPDCHLQVAMAEPQDLKRGDPLDVVKSSRKPPDSPITDPGNEQKADDLTLSPQTNLVIQKERRQLPPNAVTATESQSTSREDVTHLSTSQRVASSQSIPYRVKDRHHTSIGRALRQSLSGLYRRGQAPAIENKLVKKRREIVVPDVAPLAPLVQKVRGEKKQVSTRVQDQTGRMQLIDQQESASTFIPTITTTTVTTGCNPGLLDQGGMPMQHSQLDQPDGSTEDCRDGPATPTWQRVHGSTCTATTTTGYQGATPPRPGTAQSDPLGAERHPLTSTACATSARSVTTRTSFLKPRTPGTPRPSSAPQTRTHSEEDLRSKTAPSATASPRAGHKRKSSDNSLEEDAAQAAARVAMVRSRATAIDIPARWGEANNAKQRPKQATDHGDDADTGGPLPPVETGEPRKHDALTMSCLLCLAVVDTAVKGFYAWWTVVKPAFDEDSGLRRRRQMQQSTFADLGIFVLAGAFCLFAVSVVWFVLKSLRSLFG